MPHLSAVRPTRRWSIAVLASLSVAALAVLPGQIGAVHAAHAPAPPKPTIVLEHGAWADSSSWAGVVQRLQHAGYTVAVPPNPLRGLPNDAAYLADFLATISGTVVLVGHSYGGAVTTNAATGNANVKALVYIDAFIPDQGETLLQLVSAQPGSCLGGDPTQVFNVVPYPGAPAGDVDLYVKPSLFPNCFANGLPADEGAVLAATQRPLAFSAAGEPSGAPAWKTIPSWSLVGTADNAIPPTEQLFMSQRAGAHITQLPVPHLAMIARPGAVAAIIMQAAQATR
jgi:pimeloyl-ACP methyl ester carboxylesterase